MEVFGVMYRVPLLIDSEDVTVLAVNVGGVGGAGTFDGVFLTGLIAVLIV